MSLFCRFLVVDFFIESRVVVVFRVLLRVGFGDRSFVGRACSRARARFEFSVFCFFFVGKILCVE